AQALVLEDRREIWRQAGERICRQAPPAPGVYVLKDSDGRALYVGKAVHLRRRLRAHFAERRWRALKPGMSRAADAEWRGGGGGGEGRVPAAPSDRGASATPGPGGHAPRRSSAAGERANGPGRAEPPRYPERAHARRPRPRPID